MNRTRYVTQAGLIAAVYGALTYLYAQFGQPLAWGPVQFRVSEAVTVLAALTPAAIPGLWIGSMLANTSSLAVFGALGWLDVVFGSLGTLLGAMWTWRFRRRPALALLGPVLFNALIVPAYLPIMLRALSGGLDFYRILNGIDPTGSYLAMYAFGFVFIGLGEAIVVYLLGLPLLLALKRIPLIRELAAKE